LATYIVTGGAGFIGSHIAERLITAGHRVIIIDNETTGFRENVPPQAVYIKGDVTNPADVRRVFEYKPDGVFHIAGQASTIRSFDDPYDDLQTNTIGTINIVQACLAYQVPRLLYASSMTVYGHPTQIPTPETESCIPVSYYGISKYAAERYVFATAARTDLAFAFHVTAFRMFNVYGERQSLSNPYQGVAAIFLGNVLRHEPITIHGDGEQSRDFVHIDDVVDAWMMALENEATYGRVFNVGTGSRCSINTLVDVILQTLEHFQGDYPINHSDPRPGDQRHMQADISRIRETLHWEPRVSFAEGMARTIRWAIAHQFKMAQ
jgi:UDP-glucose 4-epimerase